MEELYCAKDKMTSLGIESQSEITADDIAKCSLSVCVWMLTRVAQMVTAAHGDL